MPTKFIFIDSSIRSAWRRMIHLWKPMAIWTLIVWLLLTIIFVPLTSALVGWGLLRGDRLVVSNEDILRWAFSPMGISYIITAGGVAIIAAIVRFAGLFQMIHQDIQRKPTSVYSVLTSIAPRIPTLFKVSVISIFGAVTLALIAAGGVGFFYLMFLGDFDINYYLANQPNEWTQFLILPVHGFLFGESPHSIFLADLSWLLLPISIPILR